MLNTSNTQHNLLALLVIVDRGSTAYLAPADEATFAKTFETLWHNQGQLTVIILQVYRDNCGNQIMLILIVFSINVIFCHDKYKLP
jgi:hypothetical protein